MLNLLTPFKHNYIILYNAWKFCLNEFAKKKSLYLISGLLNKNCKFNHNISAFYKEIQNCETCICSMNYCKICYLWASYRNSITNC